MTQTMRERLIAKAVSELRRQYDSERDGPFIYGEGEEDDRIGVDGRVNLSELVDAILAELREPDADTVQAVARAIGLEDSGTDIELIDEGRGSHQTYTACAEAGIAAMIDAVRGGKG